MMVLCCAVEMKGSKADPFGHFMQMVNLYSSKARSGVRAYAEEIDTMACSECNERIARMAAYIEDLRRLREGELAVAEGLRGEVEDACERLKALFPDADAGGGTLAEWITVVESVID